MYGIGWRAYDIGSRIFKNINTGSVNECVGHGKLQWHALRAYQDAERKKGVPILWDDIANDFMEDFNTDYQSPIGRMDGTFVLKAWTDLSSKAPHGQFTNFRWRAGYQKGGQNG